MTIHIPINNVYPSLWDLGNASFIVLERTSVIYWHHPSYYSADAFLPERNDSHKWLEVVIAGSMAWIYRSKTPLENYIQETWSSPGIWKKWHLGFHGPLEQVKSSEIKGYWPGRFSWEEEGTTAIAPGSRQLWGLSKSLQVTASGENKSGEMIGKIYSAFYLIFTEVNY